MLFTKVFIHTLLKSIIVITILPSYYAAVCNMKNACQWATNVTEHVMPFNNDGQVIIPESTDFDYDTNDCNSYYTEYTSLQGMIAYSCNSLNGRTVAIIKQNVLSDLPTLANKNRTSIDYYIVMRNNVFYMNKSTFNKVRIRNLVIKENIIQYLNEDTLENIDGLKNLIIKKNDVRSNKGNLNISHNLFRKLENLTGLYIEENRFQFNNLLRLYRNDTNYTSKLPNLKMLSFQGTYFNELTTELFKWLASSSLKTLNMRFTNISSVTPGVFKFICKSLQTLDLSSANISLEDLITLMESLKTSEYTSKLSVLSLANLNLKEIPFDALKPVQHSLKALSLFGNNFNNNENQNTSIRTEIALQSLECYTTFESAETTKETETISSLFPVMPMLYELDLRNCSIMHIEKGFFNNLNNLKKLYISFNNILILPSNVFYGLNNLIVLDISYNRHNLSRNPFEHAMTLQSESFAGLNSLKYLNFSQSKITWESSVFLSNLPPTLRKLSLCQTSLMYLNENIFDNLSQLTVLDISYNFALGPHITNRQFAKLKRLQVLHIAGIALQNISMMTNLISLKTLNIRCNNIVNLENLLDAFTKLQFLDVSWNFVTSWNERIFENNKNLRTVFLHSNSVNVITDAMLLDLKSLSYLSLGANQLVCNCNLKKLMDYVKLEYRRSFQTLWLSLYSSSDDNTTSLTIIDYDQQTTYLCFDTSSSETVVSTNTKEFCRTQSMNLFLPALGYAVYTIAFVIIAILLVCGLIYWKWWYIRYYAVIIKNATVFGYINSNRTEDRIYVYDVFVSYSDENRNWVIQELLPNIEDSTRLKICLHERDFQVGVGILENIISGIDRSRTLLLVISDSFLKSQWCQFEMYLAQHRLLEMCRDGLILVLLEEIPKQIRPKILKYLMVTNTYIVWPKNSNDDSAKKMFWQRLRKATCNTNFKLKQCSTA